MKEVIETVSEEEPEIYLDGFGFLPSNPKDLVLNEIRRYGNIFALYVILRYILNKLLLYPTTLLLDIVCAPNTIVKEGNLYVLQNNLQFVIPTIVSIISLFIVIIIGYFVDQKFYSKEVFIKKVELKELMSSIWVTLSFWTIANLVAYILEDLCQILGIINIPTFSAIGILDEKFGFDVFSMIILALLQEVLFRGLILSRLKIYGEKFAIICTSVLFGLFSMELLQGVKWFILSLVLCYFTLRTKNLLVTIILRYICTFGLLTIQVVFGQFEYDIAYAVVIIAGVVSVFMGLVTFVEIDVNLKNSKDDIPNGEKVFTFMYSIVFIFLVMITVFQMQGVLQFVG